MSVSILEDFLPIGASVLDWDTQFQNWDAQFQNCMLNFA